MFSTVAVSRRQDSWHLLGSQIWKTWRHCHHSKPELPRTRRRHLAGMQPFLGVGLTEIIGSWMACILTSSSEGRSSKQTAAKHSSVIVGVGTKLFWRQIWNTVSFWNSNPSLTNPIHIPQKSRNWYSGGQLKQGYWGNHRDISRYQVSISLEEVFRSCKWLLFSEGCASCQRSAALHATGSVPP